jgi:hypothetical protein
VERGKRRQNAALNAIGTLPGHENGSQRILSRPPESRHNEPLMRHRFTKLTENLYSPYAVTKN